MKKQKATQHSGDEQGKLPQKSEGFPDLMRSRIHRCKRKERLWKWGVVAAACLLLAGGMLRMGADTGHGVPGGQTPEGVDPATASLAVYPAEKSLLDVQSATLTNLTQEACAAHELSAWLPKSLPEDCGIRLVNLYDTTMTDGTEYSLLRVTYGSTKLPEDGQEQTAAMQDRLAIFVMDYRPDTEKEPYQPEKLTLQALEEIGGATFIVTYGDVCVGISPVGISARELQKVIASIGE